jgi:hypothetical protein
MQRQSSAKTTNWLWHRPEPLIDIPTTAATQSANASSDEGAELR